MVRAYVIIRTMERTPWKILRELLAIDGVLQADVVDGEVDIIAQVEADSERELLVLVTNRIQAIEGIGRTRTCITLVGPEETEPIGADSSRSSS